MNVRKQFITDCVESYQKNNKDEFYRFLALIQQRRDGLDDKKFARLKDEGEMRVVISLPNKLLNMILEALNGVDEPKFLEVKGEEKWFTKKFPQYLVPSTY